MATKKQTTADKKAFDNSVAEKNSVTKSMDATIAMVRALMGGTAAMRQAGEKLLPRWPKEDDESHASRLRVSTLFPAYSRTVTTLTGKPFSKPITYADNVPEQLEEWLANDADLEGRNLDAFAASVMESALAYGLCGVLVDFPYAPPREDGRARTQAEEEALGLRPYMVKIEPWSVLGWRSQRVNGVETLMQLRFMERLTVPVGSYGEESVEQVRVLFPGRWETHRKNRNGDWELFDSGFTTLNKIPFVPVYGQYVSFMVGRPPMLEMAYLNLKHWQSQSDQDNLLHVARVPILTVSGVDDENFDMTLGSSAAVKLPQGASAGFVEHGGAAIGAGRLSLEDLKEEMRQAGAELLVLQPGQITATQVASENSVGMSALQRITSGMQDSLNSALQFMAEWVSLDNGGNVKLFNDFGAASLAEASTSLLLAMQQSGSLSKKTLLKEVQRRGILSPDLDLDDELEAAAGDGPGTGGAQPDGEPEGEPGDGDA